LTAEIDKILPPYWSRANPIDLVGENDPELPLTVMELLLRWDGCDALINLGIFGRRVFFKHLADSVATADRSYSREFLDDAVKVYSDFEKSYIERVARLMEKYGKPVIGVSLLTEAKDTTVFRVTDCGYKGVFYETPERAVKAMSRMVEYQRYRSRTAAV